MTIISCISTVHIIFIACFIPLTDQKKKSKNWLVAKVWVFIAHLVVVGSGG